MRIKTRINLLKTSISLISLVSFKPKLLKSVNFIKKTGEEAIIEVSIISFLLYVKPKTGIQLKLMDC